MPAHHLFLPAAGRGARMNAPLPKQYLRVGDRTILEHTLAAFADFPFATRTLGIAPDDVDFQALRLMPHFPQNIQCSRGGAERADTVRLGLAHIARHAAPDDWVWVHDAARPCVHFEDLSKLKNILETQITKNIKIHGAILACAVSATVKQSTDGIQIQATLPRQQLYLAQTPQAFRLAELAQALECAHKNHWVVTDEASAMEMAGFGVQLVLGRHDNIKITYAEDLRVVAAILAAR